MENKAPSPAKPGIPTGKSAASTGAAGNAVSRTPRPRGRAQGAVLLAFPLAVVATVIIYLTFDISFWWLIPIFGLTGAAIIVLLVLGMEFPRAKGDNGSAD